MSTVEMGRMNRLNVTSGHAGNELGCDAGPETFVDDAVRVAVIASGVIQRTGLKTLLRGFPNVSVVDEAGDLSDAHQRFPWQSLDAVIVDKSAFGGSLLGAVGMAETESDQSGLQDLKSTLEGFWREPLARVATLSSRELGVLKLLGFGMSNRAIAAQLGLSERTVKAHVGQVLAKLRTLSRLQAGLVAMAHQLLEQIDGTVAVGESRAYAEAVASGLSAESH
jgi:DNA-binding NarL/FixJ family response regulator